MSKSRMRLRPIALLIIMMGCLVLLPVGQVAAQEKKQEMNTGNDPRDFSTKFMPYYRHMELKNGMLTRDFTVFGMWALSSKFALTYEIPVAREYDITGTAACAGLPGMLCFGKIPGGGNPQIPNEIDPSDIEGDGQETGMGDSIIRLFADPGWNLFGGAFLPGWQFTVPTATDAVLGTETFSGGPIVTQVWDIKKYPAPGAFFAMMHIYEFDYFKDTGRGDVSHYIGRWFLQLPINKKHKLYILTEFQPIYDFKTDKFSFWVGPEFGKAFTPGGGVLRNGGAVYFKPGYGVDSDKNSAERDWTLEVGWRFFFPGPKETWKIMQGQQTPR